MEALRKKLAAEDWDARPLGRNASQTSQKQSAVSPPSVISISSTSSSSAASSSTASSVGPPVKKAQTKKASRTIVITSDEEDEPVTPEPARPPQPQRNDIIAHSGAPQVLQKPQQSQHSLPQPSYPAAEKPHGPAVPIHIPTNRDIPRAPPSRPQAVAVNSNVEALNFDDVDRIPEQWMDPKDAEKALQDLMKDVRNEVLEEVDMAEAIVPGLREGILLLPHQVIGRKWMAERETGKRTGGILADDMGLGKTIQTIVRIVEGRAPKKARDEGYAGTTLVVCPVAVVSQWAAEIAKMAVGLTVIEHHGSSRTTDPKRLEKAHVVVTSYSVVASEHGSYEPGDKNESKAKAKAKSKKAAESSDDDSDDSENDMRRFLHKNKSQPAKASKKKDALFRVKYWRIVLDEAHNIKNRATKSAQACYALQGKYRWCLTGTPMQNNVDELYSLLKFLRLRPLDDWSEFKEKIAQPIKNGRPQRAIKRLHVVLNACMLRRTKNDTLNGKPLLNLPDRVVSVVHCKFDPEEQAFYDTVEERVRASLEKLQSAGNMQKSYTSMLVLLLRMRQACNHPSLVAQDYRKDKAAVDPKAAKDDKDLDDLDDDLADLMGGLGLSAATQRCQVCQKALTPATMGHSSQNCASCDAVFEKARKTAMEDESHLPPFSAKIRMILHLLGETEARGEGEKTIIFSQFTSMLDLIEPFLKARHIRYVRYDGSMTKPLREEALDKIKTNDKIRVILISFKAGSTGLNLTCCNNVILVDLWWNPALEDQAFDRAHRLGQTRVVNIHKLSVPGTVEERILELQEKKRALAQAALSGDKMKNMKLGLDDLMALFKHGPDRDDDDDSD